MPIGYNGKWPDGAVNSSTTNPTIELAAYTITVGCHKIQFVIYLDISSQSHYQNIIRYSL